MIVTSKRDRKEYVMKTMEMGKVSRKEREEMDHEEEKKDVG